MGTCSPNDTVSIMIEDVISRISFQIEAGGSERARLWDVQTAICAEIDATWSPSFGKHGKERNMMDDIYQFSFSYWKHRRFLLWQFLPNREEEAVSCLQLIGVATTRRRHTGKRYVSVGDAAGHQLPDTSVSQSVACQTAAEPLRTCC